MQNGKKGAYELGQRDLNWRYQICMLIITNVQKLRIHSVITSGQHFQLGILNLAMLLNRNCKKRVGKPL